MKILVAQKRMDAKLTQEQLAHKAGITSRGLQKIEAGRADVLLGTLVALAGALGCSVHDLISENGDAA